MIFDKTAWQNAEMFEIGTASLVNELSFASCVLVWVAVAAGWVEGRDFRRLLAAFPESLCPNRAALALLL